MNTRIQLLSVLLFNLLTANNSFAQETKQIVKITNLEKINGTSYNACYQNATTFRVNEKAIYREKINVNNQEDVTVVFKNIPKGKYAIAVFLDKNNNYNPDRNFFKIPTEKYGFSNNVLSALRPATFDVSVFEIKESEVLI